MAFNKRTWKGRQGVGLNKFSINGATPVTVVNQPDSITEVGDALSAGNLNDLEDRIADAFDETASQEEVTDLKNACDALDKRVENLEEKAGDYTEVDVKSVYSVPTGKAKNMVLPKIEGVSRAENQLADVLQLGNNDGLTYTLGNNGAVTISGTTTKAEFRRLVDSATFNNNHYYLITASSILPEGYSFGSSYNANNRQYFIGQPTISSNEGIFYVAYQNGKNCAWTGYINIRDLTLYFNGTIPSDADTIAKIQTNYPWLLTPSSYGTSMVKTRYEGFTSVGVNIWDEVWEIGGYRTDNGDYYNVNDCIRDKNYIKVIPSTTYYAVSPNIYVMYYDVNKNFIQYNGSSVSNGTFTTPSNCQYIRFSVASSYGTTYNHDIQICLNSASDKTTYHPYSKHTLSLPTPIELGSAGSVAEKAYLNEDGEAWKTNPLDGVDMGTMNWGYDSTYAFFYYLMNDRKEGIDFIADGYTNVGAVTDPNMANVPTMSIASNSVSGKWVYIKNTSKNASDLVNGHASWLEGVMLYYALPTPDPDTPLTVLTDNWIATEGGGTLEAVKTYPIDDSFTVGYLTL